MILLPARRDTAPQCRAHATRSRTGRALPVPLSGAEYRRITNHAMFPASDFLILRPGDAAAPCEAVQFPM